MGFIISIFRPFTLNFKDLFRERYPTRFCGFKFICLRFTVRLVTDEQIDIGNKDSLCAF